MIRRAISATLFVTLVGVAAAFVVACGGGNESTGSESGRALSVPAQSNETSGSMPVPGLAPMAPSGSADQSAGEADLAPSQSSVDRKVVQNASLELKVNDVPRAYQDAAQVALDEGGLVLDSSLAPTQDKPEARLTLRVPAASYEDALKKLSALAIKVDNQTSNAQDVTDQYTDLQARLRSAQAVEARYLDLLNRANTIDDILKVQDRLAPVRLEIEQIQGQINVMDNLSSNATISVHLYSEAPKAPASNGGPDPLAAAANGWESSLLFLRAVATGILATSAFLWWFAPVLAVAVIVLVVRYRRTSSMSCVGGGPCAAGALHAGGSGCRTAGPGPRLRIENLSLPSSRPVVGTDASFGARLERATLWPASPARAASYRPSR